MKKGSILLLLTAFYLQVLAQNTPGLRMPIRGEESDLEAGVWGLRQPGVDAAVVVPEVLFMPLVGFTARGDRLGQGGGYYDRYLAAHPQTIAIGMAWDVQEVPELPTELHDIRLSAIVTPTRVLGPF